MKLRTTVIPEMVVPDTYGRHPPVTFPETEHTWSPTLAAVHKWLWEDGPLYRSWHDGWLCPFHSDVGHKNITCSPGLRSRCYGILITNENRGNSPLKTLGKVVCYEWGHVLTNHYWTLQHETQDQMIATLPDDTRTVAFHILHLILRSSNWWNWRQEPKRRQTTKQNWLQPIKEKY